MYIQVHWPWQEAGLSASLQQLGKSRADLWQLAGLIALERSLERAHGTRTCIKRKKIDYGKFFDFCAEKCVYN